MSELLLPVVLGLVALLLVAGMVHEARSASAQHARRAEARG